MTTKQQNHAVSVLFWMELCKNTVLTLIKGSIGIISGNKALLSDALYSAGETGSLVIYRFKQSNDTESSGEHRKNAEQARKFMSFLIPLAVMFGGIELAISSMKVILRADPEPPHMSALIAAATAVILAEVWFQYGWRRTDKETESSVTSRYLEQHRYALYTSLLVLLGIIIAMIGKTWGHTLLLYADPVAAFITSGIVIWRSYLLLTSGPIQPVKNERFVDTYDYMQTVQRVHGIVTVEHIRANTSESGIHIDITISVNPRMSILEAQEVADRSKVLLMGRFKEVSLVQLQVIPYQSEYPYKSNCELAERETHTLLQ